MADERLSPEQAAILSLLDRIEAIERRAARMERLLAGSCELKAAAARQTGEKDMDGTKSIEFPPRAGAGRDEATTHEHVAAGGDLSDLGRMAPHFEALDFGLDNRVPAWVWSLAALSGLVGACILGWAVA